MDFQQRLQAELARRRNNNARYSLRAFARDLAIDHSALSQILRRRRRLTARVVRRLGRALRLPQIEIDSATARANADAIVNVVGDPAFRPDCRWIASKLLIRVDEVQIALHEVLRSGRVIMRSHRQWEVANG